MYSQSSGPSSILSRLAKLYAAKGDDETERENRTTNEFLDAKIRRRNGDERGAEFC